MSLCFSKTGSQLKRQLLSLPVILRIKKKTNNKQTEFCTETPNRCLNWMTLISCKKEFRPEPEWGISTVLKTQSFFCLPLHLCPSHLAHCHFCTAQSSGKKNKLCGTLSPCGNTQEVVYVCLSQTWGPLPKRGKNICKETICQ